MLIRQRLGGAQQQHFVEVFVQDLILSYSWSAFLRHVQLIFCRYNNNSIPAIPLPAQILGVCCRGCLTSDKNAPKMPFSLWLLALTQCWNSKVNLLTDLCAKVFPGWGEKWNWEEICWISLLLAVVVDCHWEMDNRSLLGFSITFIPSVKRKKCSVLKACLIWNFLFLMYGNNFLEKNQKRNWAEMRWDIN